MPCAGIKQELADGRQKLTGQQAEMAVLPVKIRNCAGCGALQNGKKVSIKS